MTNWIINLGFDTGANNPGTELQWGLTTANGTAGFISNMTPADSVQFTIYNITAGANPNNTGVTISGLSLTSSAALTNQTASSPWASGTVASPMLPTSWSSGNPGAFAGTGLPTMQVLSSGGSGALQASLTNQGQFALTFAFIVTTTNGTQMNFAVDPVMIVTSG